MNDDLREQLESYLRHEAQGRIELQRALSDARPDLSEDAWLDMVLGRVRAVSPSLAEAIDIGSLVAYRGTAPSLSFEVSDLMIQSQVDRVYPYVVANREASGRRGGLSPDEVTSASMQASLDSIEQMQQVISSKADATGDPRRRKLLTSFAEIVQMDLADLQNLSVAEESAKSEMLDRVTERMVERMEEFTLQIQRSADPPTTSE